MFDKKNFLALNKSFTILNHVNGALSLPSAKCPPKRKKIRVGNNPV
jgi:hypothetical protein